MLTPVAQRYEVLILDLDDTLISFETPIVFLLGRHDWQVPSVIAARYFERIHSPAADGVQL